MGTHCYIALEDATDGTVRYMYNHYDGYFSHIIPLLRKYYMERNNVEKLIACGNTSSLPLPHECLTCLTRLTRDKEDEEDEEDEDNQSIMVINRYVFDAIARANGIEYYYLFTKENKWECQTMNMIDIDKLDY